MQKLTILPWCWKILPRHSIAVLKKQERRDRRGETGEERHKQRQERRDRKGETGEERQERRDRRGETQTLVVALTYMS